MSYRGEPGVSPGRFPGRPRVDKILKNDESERVKVKAHKLQTANFRTGRTPALGASPGRFDRAVPSVFWSKKNEKNS